MTDRLVYADINLAHYRHNISVLRRYLSPQTAIMAIIKANAYGHGLVEIARAAAEAGVSHLGVVSLGELKQLRQAGITTPVLLLNYIDKESIEEALHNNASLTVMDETSIIAVQKIAQKNNIVASLHLEVDTGMHRAGCESNEAVHLAQQIAASPNLSFEGIFTHFAEAEDADSNFTTKQLALFSQCLHDLHHLNLVPPLVHTANSAATLTRLDSHFTMVRPGIITYGINPLPANHPDYSKVEAQFLPVLSLRTRVAYLRTIKKGETVGYNRTWSATRPSVIALLPVGYGDGWRRGPKNPGFVIIRDTLVPIIGTVSMDQIIVDCTDVLDVTIGDEVTLLGSSTSHTLSAHTIAHAIGTIPYEVTTALSQRIVRHYTGRTIDK